jgi:hypothetical protein
MRNRIKKPQLLNESFDWYNKDGFISFSGKRILILSTNMFKNKTVDRQLHLDYLVLTNNTKVSMQELQAFIYPKKVIVDLSYRQKDINSIKENCYNLGIDCYAIKDNGAFKEEME